jgi:hypothetical protein
MDPVTKLWNKIRTSRRNAPKTFKAKENSEEIVLKKENRVTTQQKNELDAAVGLLQLNEQPRVLMPQEVPYFGSTGNMKILDVRMGNLINGIFGNKMVNDWKKSAHNRTGRQIYELASVNTQCIETIGDAGVAKNCWICGFPLDLRAPNQRSDELKPSCDHVLPIAQAVFFLGLYSTRKRTQHEKNPEVFKKDIIALEYAWSHLGCNIEKQHTVLIKETIHNDAPIWSPNEHNISKMLTDIVKSSHTPEVKQQIAHYHGGVHEWVKHRKEKIHHRVELITNFINRPAEVPGLGNLTVLAGWASLVDPASMSDNFLDFIHVDLPGVIRHKRKQTRRASPKNRKIFHRKTGKKTPIISS